MRITLLAVGSRGDVQPFVALGMGLAQRGHQVTVAAFDQYRDLVMSAHLTHASLGHDVMEVLHTPSGQARLAAGRNAIRLLGQIRRLVEDLVVQIGDAQVAACSEADLVVHSPLGLAGWFAAESRRVPTVRAALVPLTPTREFAEPMAPWGRRSGPLLNRMSYVISEQIQWQMFRRPINRYRVAEMKLRRLPLRGPSAVLRRRGVPVVYGFSESVVPRPADWPSTVHITGYWFLDPLPQPTPPTELVDFLGAGPAPVYVGFGSVVDADPTRASAIVESLRRAKVRGVLQGITGGPPGLLDDDMYCVDEVPHTWLFPRMAATVHHGGAGTTAQAMRAGVPSVACPFTYDQHFWAGRVAALGVGPRPVPAGLLGSGKAGVHALASAVSRAVSGDAFQGRAAALRDRIRPEQAVPRACEVIESLITP